MATSPRIIIVTFVAALVLTSCSRPENGSQVLEAWNELNDPTRFGAYAPYAYHEIPRTGRLEEMPWSDYYWATFRGGVSYRWQQGNNSRDYRSYLYEIPSTELVQTLNGETIARLSPSEKYDIAMNRPDLPLTRSERNRSLASVRNGEIPTWFGLCHGWAPASIMEQEPISPVAVRNDQGQTVTMYASDLRALLTKVYADAELQPKFLGQRCNDTVPTADPFGRPISSQCRDANAGAFHLVIVDFIVNLKQAFIADVSPASEVWNQPIVGYSFGYENLRDFSSSDPLAAVRAPGTVKLIDVQMTLEYAKERSPSGYEHGTVTGRELYRYTLELSAEDKIIGGEWISNARPDFLWTTALKPEGEVNGISVDWVRQLVEASRSQGPNPPTPPPTTPVPPPTNPPTPAGSLVIDFVSVNYRGTNSATANVWAIVLAPEGSTLRSYVRYGTTRQLMHQAGVLNSQRMSYSFSYSPQGSVGYTFELVDGQGNVLAAADRALP